MNRFVCIHGHFYQPPRENPWLEAIEFQDSAYPYHDWNERVTAECYAANAAARILDGEGRIVDIVNNYANLSFNFGPTLMSWLRAKEREVYDAILRADRESHLRFSGHGSAIAQPYNHMIMPLANRRDKVTQAIWGIRDFEFHFGRSPEGMWLPETAVDLESLDVLAEVGIKFTILAPSQVARVRTIGGKNWREVGSRIDPRRVYQVALPSGRTIAVFVYDGPIARSVAFERLLDRGEDFASRLLGVLDEKPEMPLLAHIATDGETYGHHHPFGDMGLAYALKLIQADPTAQLTNYAQFLANHAPVQEIEIVENSSWSCIHGVERWRSNCGCNSGGHPGWNQAWRAPLRQSLDWLRDELAPLFEKELGNFVHDPWTARNDYIYVILNRSAENVSGFLAKHSRETPSPVQRVRILKLLELQRHAMLMYTSCGWFFDDLAGIETIQIIRYAGRVVQLAQDLFGDHSEATFLDRLQAASSNQQTMGSGRQIYEKFVRPAMVNLRKVGGHFILSSLFAPLWEKKNVYCYKVETDSYKILESGKAKVGLGSGVISSAITGETEKLSFTGIHLGDHNLSAGVGPYLDRDAFAALLSEMSSELERGELTELIRLIDKNFAGSTYSLRILFHDEQREILNKILESTLVEVEREYRQLHERLAPLTRFLADLGMPPPRAFQLVGEFVLDTSLSSALRHDTLDLAHIEALLHQAALEKVNLDQTGLGHALMEVIEQKARKLAASPADLGLLERLDATASLLRTVPFRVDITKAQNIYFEMLRSIYPQRKREASLGNATAAEWNTRFVALGNKLSIRLD